MIYRLICSVRALLVVIALGIVTPLMAASTTYYTTTVNGIAWTYSVSGGAVILGTGSSDPAIPVTTTGSITVPSMINNKTVTGIGEGAFSGCGGLTAVTIPAFVTSIGESAFEDCTGLKSMTISASVTRLGDAAFAGCSALTSMAIPASVKSIGNSVFEGCSGLKSVSIPASVTSIGVGAFSGCSGLASLTLPGSVTSIADSAFAGCSGLKSLDIPLGVTFVGSAAFAGCSGLKTMSIPSNLTTVSADVFDGCGSLTAITVMPGNSVYTAKDGVLYNKGQTTLIRCPEGKNGSFTVPLGVEVIGEGAFKGCDKLTAISLPATANTIHEPAFEGCNSLQRIDIPESSDTLCSVDGIVYNKGETILIQCPPGRNGSLTVLPGAVQIESFACKSCTGLTSVSLPSSMRIIGESAFEGCAGLTTMVFPSSMLQIGSAAFAGCKGLTSIAISDLVNSIGSDAFFDCPYLKLVHVDGDIDTVKELLEDSGFNLYGVVFDNEKPPADVYYQVSFDAQGGRAEWTEVRVREGDAVGKLPTAVRGNDEFLGWFTETTNGVQVTSTTIVTTDVTYYAQWQAKGGQDEPIVPQEEQQGDIGPDETAPYAAAATVYDGCLRDAEGVLAGTIQVKVAKGTTNKKTGLFSAKVTATAQLAGSTKKISFKNGIANRFGYVTGLAAAGHSLVVTLGVNGLIGSMDGMSIEGVRNLFSAKDAASKAIVAAVEAQWVGVINVVGEDVVLGVSIAKKGKVKVSGTVDGVKVSVTSQLFIGEKDCCIPVITTKKPYLAFDLWLREDGSVAIAGLGDVVAGEADVLKEDAALCMDGTALALALPGLYEAYLPNGLPVAASGTKWVVAGGAKAGKVVIDRTTGGVDEAKLGSNPSGLKFTYKTKTGSFTGSFKAYALENGRIKSYTVNITGVMVGDKGYGMATLKKPAVSFPIVIE